MTRIVVDTSVLVALYRDRTGETGRRLGEATRGATVLFVPFVELEILQGAGDDNDWSSIATQVAALPKLDIRPSLWSAAARIYFDLRRSDLTVRSTIDCCIAQMCLDHDCLLLHLDGDFEAIATVRPLREKRLDAATGSP